MATFIGWRFSVEYTEQVAQERFTFATDEAELLIEERMLEYEQALRGGVGLFGASSPISRDDWRHYVETLRIQRYFPGIQGMGFARLIPPEALADFEADIRRQGFPDFKVTPAGPRDIYTAIEFLEPFDARNQRAFGYDMFSHPVRRAAMARSRDTGEAAMSGRVVLLQETDTDIQPGVLTYLPVYRRDHPTSTIAERREALVGYVYAPFRMRDLMSGILEHTRREVDVQVYDGPTVNPATFLHQTFTPDAVAGAPGEPRFTETRQMTISGQLWTIVYTTNENFDQATVNYLSNFVVGTGIAIDLLLFTIIAALGARYRSEHVAATTSAAKAQQYAYRHAAILKSAGSVIVAANAEGVIVEFNPAAEKMLGYTAAEMIDRETPAVFHDPDEIAQRAGQFSKELGRPLEPGFEVFVAKSDLNLPNTHEWTYISKDGNRIPVLLTVTALRDSNDAITGYLGVAHDISVQAQAQRRLANTLAEVKSLTAALNEHSVIAVTDLNGFIREANDKFCDIYGYAPEEFIGQDYGMLKSGVHDGAFFAQMWGVISSGRPWHGEICNRAKDGRLRWIDTSVLPVLDADGVPRKYIAVSTDITPQRQLVKRLELTQHIAAIGGWDVDLIAGTVRWTDVTYDIHELERGSPIDLDQGIAFYHPNDRQRVRDVVENAIATGESWDLELRITTAKGHEKWVRAVGRVEMSGDNAIALFGTFQDIHETKTAQLALRASEERFRTLAAVLPIGIWEVNAEGDCLYTNRAYQESTELTLEETLGRGYTTAVHPEDVDGLFAAWNRFVTGTESFEHEFRFRTKSGQIRWVHSQGTAIKRDGQTLGYVGANLDITESRQAMNDMAASLHEKEILLREVHHRVKNNLQLVSSLLNLQAGYISDPTTLTVFRESQQRIRSMALVHEMLYAHTSLASIQIDVYLKELAGSLRRNFPDFAARILPSFNIAPLHIQPEKAIPLGLIVNELLTNAFKHGMRDDSPLEISIDLQPDTAGRAVLQFSDNGPGMPADVEVKTPKSLGLRLISLLSRQLQATVTLPQAGQPAHFEFILPIDPPSTADK